MVDKTGQFVTDETILDGDANRVVAVTVFAAQAYVKRAATAKVVPGLNRVCIEIQAHRVDTDSCQAAVLGSGEILSVQYRRTAVAKTPQADLRELDEQLEQLRRDKQPLLDEQAMLDTQKQFLDAVNGLATVELPKRMRTEFPSVENLTGMVEFLGAELGRIQSHGRELRDQLEELNKQVIAVEERRTAKAAPVSKHRQSIEVLFRSDIEQELQIGAAYVVQNASWEAVHKADVEPDLSGLQLTMFAKVRQNTGEPWRNVTMSVSNVAPSAGGELPDLDSWYLRPLQQRPRAVTAARMSYAGGAEPPEAPMPAAPIEDELDDAVGEIEAIPPRAAVFAESQVTQLPNAFEYELPEPVSIDSGDDESILPLASRRPQGAFSHWAVPKRDTQAYLVCEVTPDSDMVAGTVNVFMGGRFLASTQLGEKRPGEPFRINLGPDRGVKIRRETPPEKLREKFLGVKSSKVTRSFDCRIAVENLKDAPATLDVLEAVPIPATDAFKIRDVELTPEPTERDYDEREGVMRWRLELAPGATDEIHARFTVTYPRHEPPAL